MQTKGHHTQRQSRYRLELGLKEHLQKRTSPFLFLSVPSDRMGEPTRQGVRTAVLRLRRGHAWDDTLDTSRVFWVNRWMMRERRMMMTKLGKEKQGRWGPAYDTRTGRYKLIFSTSLKDAHSCYQRLDIKVWFQLNKWNTCTLTESKQVIKQKDGNRKQYDIGLIYFTQTIHYISSS